MSTREIVTLQIGHYANFVGTHWWNIQVYKLESTLVYNNLRQLTGPKEINHDVLFREGQTLHGEVTYTPRLIAVDLKGSLNALRREGILYESRQGGRKKSETEDAVFGRKLYNLDNNVSVWSDFLRVHLHPKSLHIVDDFIHKNEDQTWDMFQLRFHMLLDWCDGLGYGASLLQYLEGEMHKQGSDDIWGHLETFPHLSYKGELDYHTSGIMAACLDTLSLPYRREGFATQLADITASFNNLGRKVAAVYSSLPFPLTPQGTFVESLMSHKDHPPWYSLTPHVGTCLDPYMQSCVVRGVPDHKITRSQPTPDIPRILTGCSSLAEVLHLYLSETYPQSLNAGCTMRDACKVVSPYPHVFSSNVTSSGYICDTDRPSYQGVESVPVMTSLQSNDSVYNLTSSLHNEASRFNIKKHHHYLEAGLEEDEYRETLDNVSTLGQCYKTDTSIS
ncbi:LOW QUALITY PROTEIN: protein misato homolog 1-like [Haliotis rubra]|uniref:LOW QUALITY PROTEIN: protein misato homolog 1-like n=1 Tax=Haliotis rubra TaxID=36100 RepID=UPI001EE55FDF|nr:LOW QUALITY PROTEIN: protein misato homolog 1-like [Haliotis rubra]